MPVGRMAGAVATCAAFGMAGVVVAQTDATWTNASGDGDYGNAVNWSPKVVPLNSKSATFHVIVPSAASNLTFGLPGTHVIDELTLGTGRLFSVSGGASELSIDLGVAINNARVRAINGGTLRLPAFDIYSTSGIYDTTVLQAEGAGSVLDMSGLFQFNATFNDGGGADRYQNVYARDGGHLDLSSLRFLDGPRGDDYLQIIVETGGSMDLSSLEAFVDGDIRFTVDVPSMTFPSLTSSRGVSFLLGPGTEVDLPALEELRSSSYNTGGVFADVNNVVSMPMLTEVLGAQLRAYTGSTITAPNLTYMDDAYLRAYGGLIETGKIGQANDTELRVTAGGTLAMPGLTYFASNGVYDRTILQSEGPGSLLDLSALLQIDATFNDGGGADRFQNIIARDGGHIDLSALQFLDGPRGDDYLQVILDTGGSIDFSSLQAIVDGDVRVIVDVPELTLPMLTSSTGAVFTFGPGTTLDLPVLEELRSSSYQTGGILADDNNIVSAPMLADLVGAQIRAYPGSMVSVPQLTFMEDAYLRSYGGLIETGVIGFANDTELHVTAGGTLALPGLAYFNSAGVYDRTILLSEGRGSVLELPSLTQIDATFNDGGGADRYQSIIARDGGHIDFSSLTHIDGPRGDDYLQIILDTGGSMDFSVLESIVNGDVRFIIEVPELTLPSLATSTGALFQMAPGTSLDLPVLEELRSSSYLTGGVQADDNNVVTMPALTDVIGAELRAYTGSSISAPNLTYVEDAYLRAYGGVIETGRIGLANDTELRAFAGGHLAMPALTYFSTSGLFDRTVLQSEGPGSLLDLSSLTQIDATFNDGGGADRFQNILARDGGHMDLSALQVLDGPRGDDYLQVIIDSGGSIDFDSFQEVQDGDVRFTINVPYATFPSLTLTRGASFSIGAGAVVNFPLLAQVQSSSYHTASISVGTGSVLNLGSLEILGGFSISTSPGATVNVPNLQEMSNFNLVIGSGSNWNVGSPSQLDNSRVTVMDGRSFEVAATSYSSTGLGDAALFTAQGSDSVLDLSSIEIFNAAGDSSGVAIQEVTATTNGLVDLSGLQTVTGRQGDDRLEFIAEFGGMVDLSGLQFVADGNVRFDAYGLGSVLDLSSFGLFEDGVSLDLGAACEVRLAALCVRDGGRITASEDFSGSPVLVVEHDIIPMTTDGSTMQIERSRIVMRGTDATIEAASPDLGPIDPGVDQFALGAVTYEPASSNGILAIDDKIANSEGGGEEVVYLMGVDGSDGVIDLNGGTLALNGQTVYAMQDGLLVNLRDLLDGGQGPVPYKNGFITDEPPRKGLEGDVNGDGMVGLLDLLAVLSEWGCSSGCDADVDGDGMVGLTDLLLVLAGWS